MVYDTNLSIRKWAEEDRPREKMILKGKAALSETELLAILIRSGTRSVSAVELARQILKSVNNDLNKLARLSIKELMRFNGIGETKAINIVGALELGRRRKNESSEIVKSIQSSQQVYDLMQSSLLDLKHEQFWTLYLDRSNKLIRKELIGSGGISGTLVDPRLIFKKALEELACSIILVHNHPSGNLKPSKADKDLTKKLKEAGKFLDIQVLDHIIFTDNSYFSFADESML